MQIADFMTLHPTTVSPSSSVGDALRVMVLKGFRHLPVLDGERRLVAMVSERDLRGVEQHIEIQHVMTTSPMVADDSQDLRHATDVLAREGIGALPIVAHGTDDVLVGIITSVDVLAAHRDAPPSLNISRALVPIDLESAAFETLSQVCGLFDRALTTALYVVPPQSNASPAALLGSTTPAQRQSKALETVSALLKDKGFKDVDAMVEIGEPAECIASAAAALGVDVIVIAPHNRGAVERFFVGSVTEEVVRSAPCPVLVLRGDLLGHRSTRGDD